MMMTERFHPTSECSNQTQDDQREPSAFQRGTHYGAADAPSQTTTTEAGHYLEILETSYYQNVDVSPEQHLEFISDDDDDDDDGYDQPESPYDHLDRSAVIITPPAPSVYDRLTH